MRTRLLIMLISFLDVLFVDFVRYYSLYGHVEVMARQVQRGANSVDDVEATLWQVVFYIVE